MHLSLILLAAGVAWMVRCGWSASLNWTHRWQQALWRFLLAPLLLVMTALAVLGMGTQGQMLGLPVGWIGYSLALGFLLAAGATLIGSAWQCWRSVRQIRSYPVLQVCQIEGRLLDIAESIGAQVGFWQPELVLSRGLLTLLNDDQLDAVLTHEQAHRHYRDTFWFFWLGWLRQFTSWLPQTEALWQELLLLRELRADQWAARRVDALLLAESLLLVVQTAWTDAEHSCAFSAAAAPSRIEERIEALLAPVEPLPPSSLAWMGLIPALLPLLTVLLHR